MTEQDFAELRRLCERLAFATGASLPPCLDTVQDVLGCMSQSVEVAGKRVMRGRQDQRQLKQVREELERVEHLKTRFVRSVTHELRTPLASIEGFAHALLKLEDEPIRPGDSAHDRAETRRQFLTIISREAHRLEEMIESVLDLSEAESSTRPRAAALFNAREIFEESIAALERTAPVSAVTLRLKPAPDGPSIYAERDAVKEILRQLLSNAQKYSAGQEIVLSAEYVTIGPEKTRTESGFQAKVTGATRIMVKDKGVGIPREELENIFDRFYRVEKTASAFPGNGLGLSLVRALVAQNNGQVWAESEVGTGSTFIVLLPNQPSGSE